MSPGGSVSAWIGRLKAGDPEAAQQLWQRYFTRLVGLARKKLWGARRRVADEEDVALSALDSFCRAAARGRFPRQEDRDDLWRLLLVITARKAIDLVQRERRDRAVAEATPAQAAGSADAALIEQIVGDEPTPEFAAQVAEECERLLTRLETAELRSVAVWKMEGYTNEEIAARLGCALATVERRLRLIRKLWDQAPAP
jgi:DNA-directed RNA polymerase specialized sigma24 family protein